MRKYTAIILIIFLAGCSKSIIIDGINNNSQSIKKFGISDQNIFLINQNTSDSLKLEWNSDTHGSFNNTSFIAYDTILIVSDVSGRITSFNINNGKELGEIKNDGEISQAPIILNSTLIFVVNEYKEKYSNVIFYDLLNGKQLNKIKLKGKFITEIPVLDNNFFLTSELGEIYKISKASNILWSIKLNEAVHSNSTVDESFLYLITLNGNFIKINVNNGKIISKTKITDKVQSGISADKNYIFFGDDLGNIFCINKNDATIKWSFNSGSRIVQTLGFDDQNLFVGNLNGDFFRIDKRTGKLNWKTSTNGLYNSSPLIFNNYIFQSNLFGSVDIFDKKNGELINKLKFESRCKTTPIFYKNRLFVGADKGEVYCYSFGN